MHTESSAMYDYDNNVSQAAHIFDFVMTRHSVQGELLPSKPLDLRMQYQWRCLGYHALARGFETQDTIKSKFYNTVS